MTATVGTATVAKIFIAIGVAQVPTVSTLPEAFEAQVRPAHKLASRTHQSTQKVAATTVANDETFSASSRATTSVEKLIGEIRNWALFDSNWDGEGSAKPSMASIKEVVSFARLLETAAQEPEPMLLASGHTALFWNDGNLYADLEFLGDSRIAYFIKKNGDKHKGVVGFDSENMPAVFQALIGV